MNSFFTKFFLSFVVFTFLFISTGCGSRGGSRKASQNTLSAYQKQYVMHVDGVECQFCAQAVIDLISKLPAMSNVRYYTTDDTYQESYVTFLFDTKQGALPVEQLKNDLAKEEFCLVSLKNRSQESLGLPASGK